jgi:hypothetical protein
MSNSIVEVGLEFVSSAIVGKGLKCVLFKGMDEIIFFEETL